MADPRQTTLAETLIHYSCEIKPGEKVLIEAVDIPHSFTHELVRVAAEANAHPLVTLKSQSVWRALMNVASDEQMRLIGEAEGLRMGQVDAYIGIRGNENVSEWADVPADRMKLYEQHVWK